MLNSDDENADSLVAAALKTGLAKYSNLNPRVVQSIEVDATIADDIKYTSIKSVIVALISIFISTVLRFRKWQFGSVFTYAGMNAITIYFVSSLVSKSMYLIPVNDQDNVHSYLYSALLESSAMSDKFTSLVYALAVVVFYLMMGYVLYRKKIFIKI